MSDSKTAIGGYFELELPTKGDHYHYNALKLNSGRCAFEYILRVRNYKKVYLPYYTCDVMLEPIENLGLKYQFYHINEKLEPIFDKTLDKHDCFVYTNYYGIKQETVKLLSNCISNLIIDNSQAFFCNVIKGVDTFYSARKFFGVPDGAYLYIDKYLDYQIAQNKSYDKMSHLLKRLEFDAQSGYADFCANDNAFKGQPIQLMSAISDALLKNIDYDCVKAIREKNFVSLHKILGSTNRLQIFDKCPSMVYPYWPNHSGMRERLIEQSIFVAKYWPNVSDWLETGLEVDLQKELLALPIDQRYNQADMLRIIKTIQQ